jgi:hypothetical protein
MLFHIISETVQFSGEKVIEHKFAFSVSLTTFVVLSDLIKPKLSRQIFEKYSNINFNKNPPVGCQLFHAGGRAGGQTDRQADIHT